MEGRELHPETVYIRAIPSGMYPVAQEQASKGVVSVLLECSCCGYQGAIYLESLPDGTVQDIPVRIGSPAG